MKKLSYFFSIAAAVLFAGCNNESLTPETTEDGDVMVFVSAKPEFDDNTKTAWDGSKVDWSVGDQIRVACYNYTTESWRAKSVDSNSPKAYKSDALRSENIVNGIARFSFQTGSQFTISNGSFRFFAYSPAASTDFRANTSDLNNAPILDGGKLKVEQPINANGFDASTDIMVGASTERYTSNPYDSEIEMKWKRLVAFPVITFKGLKDAVSGEKVTSIKITAQEGATLSGAVDVDIFNATIAKSATLESYNYVIARDASGVALDGTNSITTWFTTLPFKATSLKVDIETDKASYTRSIDLSSNNKSFLANKRNLLTIDMSKDDTVRTPIGGGDQGGDNPGGEPGETKNYNTTYDYDGAKDDAKWSLTNKEDATSFWKIPSGDDPSVATFPGVFAGKNVAGNITITINMAAFGTGTNPSSSNISFYTSSSCASSVVASTSSSFPINSTYVNVVYTITKTNAANLTNDLAIKFEKPGKQIRLKSVKIQFDYTEGEGGDDQVKTLSEPSDLSWNASTKTLSWRNTNTDNGTYGTDYKYEYRLGTTGSWTDATSATTAVLSSLATTTKVYVRAFAINTTSYSNSAETANYECTVAGGNQTATGRDMTAKTTDQYLESGKPIKYRMSAANSYSNPLRVYQNNTLTISGATIKKITLTGSDGSYPVNRLSLKSGESGTITTSTTTKVVWEFETGTTSVTFKASAQARLDKIEVIYSE